MKSGIFTSPNGEPPSLPMQLVLLLFLSMLGSLFASLLVQSIEQMADMDYMETIQNLNAASSDKERNFIRVSLMISHLFTFILPALFFIAGLYRSNWKKDLRLTSAPKGISLFQACLLLFCAFPFIQFVYFWNRQLPLPQWAIGQEELINNTLNHLLQVNGPEILFLNILTMALLPAIGEELVFRGILQQLFEKAAKNKHIGVWIAAFIFSFIHFQFQGFVPRFLLGALLGYLFVWTNNLWTPIIAHFFYNALQVLVQFLNQLGILGLDLNEIEQIPWWIVMLSVIVSGGIIGWLLKREEDFHLNHS